MQNPDCIKRLRKHVKFCWTSTFSAAPNQKQHECDEQISTDGCHFYLIPEMVVMNLEERPGFWLLCRQASEYHEVSVKL